MKFVISLSLLISPLIFSGDLSNADVAKKNYQSMNKAVTDYISTSEKDRNLACIKDEQLITSVEKKLIMPLEKILLNKGEFNNVSKYVKNKNGNDFSFLELNKQLELDGISSYAVSTGSTNYEGFTNSMNSLLGDYKNIKDVDLDITSYLINPSHRSANTLTPNRIRLMVSYDIRGEGKNNKIRKINDRGQFQIDIHRKKRGWLISSWKVVEGERVSLSREPSFVDNSKKYGLNKLPIHLRREAIRRGGYGMAISDINGDQALDIYVGSMNKGDLLMGDSSGKFKKKNSLVDESTAVKAVAFADFDNDGDKDVVLTRFIPKDNKEPVKVFYNDGKGNFESRGKNVELKDDVYYAMPLALGDFNNDDLMDFYVGYPGNRDFTHLEGIEENRIVEGLYVNNVKEFKDNSSKLPSYKNSPANWKKLKSAQHLYPHASIAVDYDQDGDQDIIVIDDRNNLSPVYGNEGNGSSFLGYNKIAGVDNRGYGMGVNAGDLNNDGRTDLIMSNVVLNTHKRIAKSCDMNVYLPSRNIVARDINIYTGTGNGKKLIDDTERYSLSSAGDALGGVMLVDYNNDGLLDIYAVNGLWSGTSRDQKLDDLWTKLVFLGISNFNAPRYPITKNSNNAKLDAASEIMDVLAYYRDDKGDSPSMGGYQRNRLYRNLGNGKFLEVGHLEGVDSIADGYMAAFADLDRDGKLEFVLRNADPGVRDYEYAPVQIYKNQYANDNSVVLELKTAKARRDAFGAYAIADFGNGKKQVAHLLGNLGAVQSEPIVHFGLGQQKQLKRLTVHWPSGAVSTHENVKKGRHVLVAPNTKSVASVR